MNDAALTLVTSPPDTSAVSQHLATLGKPELKQAADVLATNCVQQTAIARHYQDLYTKMVPKHVTPAVSFSLTLAGGASAGAAYGALKAPYGLVAVAAGAAAGAVVGVMSKDPEISKASLSFAAGLSAGSAAIETKEKAESFMSKRAAAAAAAKAA